MVSAHDNGLVLLRGGPAGTCSELPWTSNTIAMPAAARRAPSDQDAGRSLELQARTRRLAHDVARLPVTDRLEKPLSYSLTVRRMEYSPLVVGLLGAAFTHR